MKESVKELIKEELRVAEKRLKAAKILFKENMLEDAVNRAYYAVFYAAKAMLNSLGYDAKTHSGLISEFGLRIIKEGLLPMKYGRILRRAFEMRESGDYEIGVFFDRNEVKGLIKNAEEFIKRAKKFVREQL